MFNLYNQVYNPQYLKQMKDLQIQLKDINQGGSKYGHQMRYSTVCDLLKFVESKGIKIATDVDKAKSGEIILVGSTGRLRPLPEDLDFLVIDIPIENIVDFVNQNFKVQKVIEKGPKQFFVLVENNRELNFWHTSKEELPYSYFTYAYPKKLTIALRKKAKSLGFKLNQKGLYKNNKLIHVKSYKDIFDYLQIPYRSPIEETIRQIKYKHYANTSDILEKIRKNQEVDKWINMYGCH